MGMSSGGDDHGSMSEINVTPFVDVMLVLLIIFMVTAPMMTQGVQIDVPDTEGAPLPASEDQLTISVNTEGKFFIEETPYELDELDKKLKALFIITAIIRDSRSIIFLLPFPPSCCDRCIINTNARICIH